MDQNKYGYPIEWTKEECEVLEGLVLNALQIANGPVDTRWVWRLISDKRELPTHLKRSSLWDYIDFCVERALKQVASQKWCLGGETYKRTND
ncbi:MAG: hypothetical protein OEY01_03535 [Desulfobulbaceae bacterium]|nr:hypothetical protein [Desulfobulbaceae bacterium]